VSLPAGLTPCYAYDPLKLHGSPVVGAEDLVEHGRGESTVTDGQQQSVDLSMPLGGHVSGTVNRYCRQNLWRALIVDVDPASAYVLDAGGETTTDSNGHYDVGALDTGAYGCRSSRLSARGDVPVSVLIPTSAASGPRTPYRRYRRSEPPPARPSR